MATTVSTIHTHNNKGFCKVKYSSPDCFEIEYFDNQGRSFFVEEYPNLKLSEVESIAEDWILGYHKLDIETELAHEV